MAYQGLRLVASDGATCLLSTTHNIAEAIQLLFPVLASQAPTFEETLNWLQFTYTGYRTGDYMACSSTVLATSEVSKGDTIFPDI